MLKLYHWEPNAESLALLICLRELGAEVETSYVDVLQQEHYGSDYLGLSPKSIVPLLIADEVRMTDTMLALQYLSESNPSAGLTPSDPAFWYDLQAWMSWLGGVHGLAADVQLLGWNYAMLKVMPADQLDEFRARVAELPKEIQSGWAAVWSDAEAGADQLGIVTERVQKLLSRMQETLQGSLWLLGYDYSIVDIAAFSYVHGLVALLPDVLNGQRTPDVVNWCDRIAARPSVVAALGTRRSELAPVMYNAPGN